ncbi:MAG: hypothetical protein IRZ26_09385, partial [Clostridia bacterium]|nr:hypothetical protein [Clostridia bacterium]
MLSLVGADLAVLLPALPELQRMADASPRAEALAPAAQRRRFLSALSRLAAACCTEDGVTVLFYDDVQDWDASTLDSAVHVFSTLRDRRLVVVCALREKGRRAPASIRFQAALRATGAELDHLRLPPLQEADGQRLVAAALGLEADRATPLAEVLFRRSGGNPLFLRHLLMAVYERGLLRYDAQVREWRWDLAAVRNMPVPDRLAPLLGESLGRLSGETRAALAWAACIGPVFDVETLAEARGQPVEAMWHQLGPALEAGLIASAEGEDAGARWPPAGRRVCRFAHDRVRAAALRLLHGRAGDEAHLALGRLLRARLESQGEAGREACLGAAFHLARAARLLASPEERRDVLRLCLRAADESLQIGDFASARRVLARGDPLLEGGQAHGSEDADLAFAYRLRRAECEYLCGGFARAEALAEKLAGEAATPFQRAQAARLQVVHRLYRRKERDAVRLGTRSLAELGLAVRPPADATSFRLMVGGLAKRLGRDGARLLAAPPAAGAAADRVRLAQELLFALSVPALYLDRGMYAAIVGRAVELALDHGPVPAVPAALAAFGAMVGLEIGDTKAGARIGRLAVELADRCGSAAARTVAYALYGSTFADWQDPPEKSERYLAEAVRSALASGDPLSVWYAMANRLHYCFALGDPARLLELVEECREALRWEELPAEMRAVHIEAHFRLFRRYAAAVATGEGAGEGASLGGEPAWDFLTVVDGDRAPSEVRFLAHTCRMKVAWLYGAPEEALRAAEEAERLAERNLYGNYL